MNHAIEPHVTAFVRDARDATGRASQTGCRPRPEGRRGTAVAGDYCTPVMDPLGKYPARSVAALADLGLSDPEIARYFGVGLSRIRAVRATGTEGGRH